MENGLPSLGAGKRRREGYPVDEDVKDNLKASRQWYGSQRGDEGLNEGYPHYSGLSMENLMRLQQQQQQQQMTEVVPHLNMQQRVEAAAALQDLRGITTFQPHMKYGVVKTDMSDQPPQSPLPLPPQPYIRTPPLHSEADIHNGSPTSSSSGPYPNMAGGAPRTSQQCSAPIQQQQLPEPESDTSYSSLLHASQTGFKAKSALQQSSQAVRGHSPQSGITQQSGEADMSRQATTQNTTSIQGSHGMSNGHPSASLLQNGVAFPLQQQQQQQQLPQGDPSRTSLHQQQGRHAMPSSSSHHQQGMQHMSQNGMMHSQIAHRMQDGMVQHQMSQNNLGAVSHQSVQSSPGSMQQPQQMGFPQAQGVQQIPNSWYPSMRDATTVSETQPSVSTSRLQRHVDAGTFVPTNNNGTMFSSPALVTDQRALPQQQLSQAQSGYRDVLPEQDRHISHGEGQSPLHTMGKVLPVQTDLQGRRFLQANNFSVPSSSAADVNFINPGVALDDPALLQRAFMIPAPKFTRSFTKVYKLGSITRAVDVNRFSNYAELRCELARMFNLDGQLDQKLGWQLVFTDNEDDLLLVGDDPWEEFVRNVRGIRILTPAEVYYYTHEDKCAPPATYNSTGGSAPKPM